jgi:hypothetical protein
VEVSADGVEPVVAGQLAIQWFQPQGPWAADTRAAISIARSSDSRSII